MADNVNAGETIWPHGPDEYRGKQLCDIPSGFLKWIADSAYNDSIAKDAGDEWHWRDKNCEHFWE